MEIISYELIKIIRSHISQKNKQAILLANRKKWLRVTSALDVLEDTTSAVEYYLDNEYPTDIRGKYLFTYGLIQALFVLSDAVKSISIALFDKDINFKVDYPDAFKIREMRNDVIGHPTCRNSNQFIYLAQHSMEKNYFYYIKEDDMHSTEETTIDVDVIAAINDIAKCVNNILEDSVKNLDFEFKRYIDMHRERKMTNIFNMLGYAKEKVLSGDISYEVGYQATKRMVADCEKEIILRYGSVDVVDSYKFILESIHEIYILIDNEIQNTPLNIQSSIKKYLLEILLIKLEVLETYCKETDSYFENYGDDPKEQLNDEPVVIINDFGEYGV